MDKRKFKETLLGGLIKNNPTFVLVLGTCPTIAMTTSLFQAFAMGVATTFVLIFSNLFVSLLRGIIPDKVRIPCYIVIISTFVIIVQMVMRRYLPELYTTMQAFIALIVVNCIILARAESFASCNKPLYSMLDGVSMALALPVRSASSASCANFSRAAPLRLCHSRIPRHAGCGRKRVRVYHLRVHDGAFQFCHSESQRAQSAHESGEPSPYRSA